MELDFMSDADGRTFRILNEWMDYNRECLLSQGSISFPPKESSTTGTIERRSRSSNYIRTDNGPEFTSNDYKDWCKINNVTPVYAEPGKPTKTDTLRD
ncbi:MAG: hypothetical protein IPN49_08140 [Saprospiraceae bacterium]|nr:hypothetical protein [Saprospiraceae bacterium]